MSVYHHFYVECRSADGWAVPSQFEPSPSAFDCHRHLGEFVACRCWYFWDDLFFGPGALFPMRLGPPADRGPSPFLRDLDKYYDYARNEDRLCWLPYPDLMMECWDTDRVTIRAPVPARHALRFGDGQQPLAAADLVAAGVSEDELEKVWGVRRLAREPVDMTFGMHRFRAVELPPARPIDVTWRDTIAGFVGEPWAAAFQGLRRYGPDDDLRILSLRG